MEVLLSHRKEQPVPHESLYGMRCNHPDLFFLSPWEFCQWFNARRLQAPSESNSLTIWTEVGKSKSGQHPAIYEPGVDYVLNEGRIAAESHIFAFPPSHEVFGDVAPANYDTFRNSWVLIKRKVPVVPCPEYCPLPNKRMSKHERSKKYSVYLRPWTLSRLYATASVPFLGDLQDCGFFFIKTPPPPPFPKMMTMMMTNMILRRRRLR